MCVLKKTGHWLEAFVRATNDGQARRSPFLYLAFAAYVVLSALVALHHETWFDEAQAWLLAREAGPLDLLVHYARYEGSPPLWHLLLMIPAKLGLPFATLKIIALAASALAVWLILFKSPFPLLFRLLLPFTFYLFFQYTIVARSYCLVMPLLALLALEYPGRREHPVRHVLLLVLLSQVSMHTALIAGGLFVCDQARDAHACRKWSGFFTRERILAGTIFALDIAFIAAVCYPPSDLTFGIAQPVTEHTFFRRCGSSICEPLCDGMWLSAAIFVCGLAFLYRRKRLLEYLLPFLLIVAFFILVYLNSWHFGFLFCLFVFALWISSHGQARWPVYLVAAMLVVCGCQIRWSWKTASFDWREPYSGAPKTAEFIRPMVKAGKSVEGYGYAAHALVAYFPKGELRFTNPRRQWHEFYTWDNDSIPGVIGNGNFHSDVGILTFVVFRELSDKMSDYWIPQYPGYTCTGIFPGMEYFKDQIREAYVYFVYVKNPAPENNLPNGSTSDGVKK